jgi:glucose/arabinose dehydrogenase
VERVRDRQSSRQTEQLKLLDVDEKNNEFFRRLCYTPDGSLLITPGTDRQPERDRDRSETEAETETYRQIVEQLF